MWPWWEHDVPWCGFGESSHGLGVAQENTNFATSSNLYTGPVTHLQMVRVIVATNKRLL
jgi:hypothetical protein